MNNGCLSARAWEEREPRVATGSCGRCASHLEVTGRAGNMGRLCLHEREHQPLWPQICKGASVCSRSACFPVGYFQWPPQEMSENLRNATQLSRTGKINLQQPPASSSTGCPPSLLTLSLHFSPSMLCRGICLQATQGNVLLTGYHLSSNSYVLPFLHYMDACGDFCLSLFAPFAQNS